MMESFQLFVPFKGGDFDPKMPQYVCVSDDDYVSHGDYRGSNQLDIYRYAIEKGTASYLGVATDQCLVALSSVGEKNRFCQEPFFKVENIDMPVLESLGYTSFDCSDLDGADIVLPKPSSWLNSEYMSPVYRHVMWYWWHRRTFDFDILESVLSSSDEEYLEDLRSYREDDKGYPLGAFLMTSVMFKSYSSWMLSVIDGYMQMVQVTEDSSWVESLAPSIIARHLLAVFVRHVARVQEGAVVAQAPCVFFKHMDNPYLQPAFDNNNIAVVLASDALYAPLMSVTVESIVRNSNSRYNYDLIILENGLSQADFEFFRRQVNPYENISLRFIHLQGYISDRDLPTVAHITDTAFARFFILEFLSAYSKVVYLDTDLVCNSDISELYEMDVSGYLLGAVRDTADAGWCNITDNRTREHIEEVVQLKRVYDYFNAGVLVMNIEEFLQETSCQALLKKITEKNWIWYDQDILNNVCAGRVKYFDQSWNYMAHRESYFTPEVTPEVWLPLWLQNAYREAHKTPKIIHYAGHATPCFSLYSDSAWYFWDYAKSSPYYEILVSIAASEMELDVFNAVATKRRELNNPLVNIIVPVYNTARYLPNLFDSLLGQTYRNIEIICVNDGSTDNSLDILHKYANDDKRIIVVDKVNSGAGATRNMGMEHVRGKYVCFVDSDDFLKENAIEQLVRTAEKHKTDVVVFGMDQYDDCAGVFSPNPWAVSRANIPIGRVFLAADISHFYKHVVGFTVNKLYRSDFLLGLDLRFPAIGAHEDMPFTYIALSASKRTLYLDKVLYHYRRSREGSLSDGTNEHYTYMFEALLCLRQGLIDRGLWDDYERNFVNYALHMCKWKTGELSKFGRLEFRDVCRRMWFERLGILGHTPDYFFDSDEYAYYTSTMEMSFARKVGARCYRLVKMQ